jgi:hypothetical protein
MMWLLLFTSACPVSVADGRARHSAPPPHVVEPEVGRQILAACPLDLPVVLLIVGLAFEAAAGLLARGFERDAIRHRRRNRGDPPVVGERAFVTAGKLVRGTERGEHVRVLRNQLFGTCQHIDRRVGLILLYQGNAGAD